MWGSKGTQYKSQFLWLLPALLIPLSSLNLSSPGSGLHSPAFSLWSYVTEPFWIPFSWFSWAFLVLLGPCLLFLHSFLPPSFFPPFSSHSQVFLWPCSVLTRQDTSSCFLPHIYNQTLLFNQKYNQSCPHFVSSPRSLWDLSWEEWNLPI